jgi:hypothetical protein
MGPDSCLRIAQRFFKTPAKTSAEAEVGSSQLPKTPMSAQPLRRPFHDIFTPAPESARYSSFPVAHAGP